MNEPMTYGPVPITDLVRYARASGDSNPLHHGPPLSMDFPGPMGISQEGLIGIWLAKHAGCIRYAPSERRARHPAPRTPGSTIRMST
jgi:acyl dehydratase